MTYHQGQHQKKVRSRAEELQAGLDVAKAELKEERRCNREIADELAVAKKKIEELEASNASCACSQEVAQLQTKVSELQKELNLWNDIVPQEGIRMEVRALLDWLMDVIRKLGGLPEKAQHLLIQLDSLQAAQRKAILQGDDKESVSLWAKIDSIIKEEREVRGCRPKIIAVITDKIIPMLERVMADHVRAWYEQKLGEIVDVPAELDQSEVFTQSPDRPIGEQPLRTIDTYKASVIWPNTLEASQFMVWAKSERFLRGASDAMTRCEDRTYESWVETHSLLRKWSFKDRQYAMHAKKFFMELPIWKVDERLGLVIDREEKLPKFFAELEKRAQAVCEKQVKKQNGNQQSQFQTQSNFKPATVLVPSQDAGASNGEAGDDYGGEDPLEIVTPGHLIVNRVGALLGGIVKHLGISQVDCLRAIGKGEFIDLVKERADKLEGNIPLARRLITGSWSIVREARAISELWFDNGEGELNEEAARQRARDILATPKGRMAMQVRQSSRKLGKERQEASVR